MRFDRTSVGPCPAPLSVGEAAVQVSSAPASGSPPRSYAVENALAGSVV